MDFVLLLWELDRSSLQQAFGPYASQDLADVALVELGNWPSLHGAWEILPLTRAGETSAASVPLPPSMTPAPVVPLWPRDGVVWCSAERAPYAAPGWTGCAPAATTPYTVWTTGMPSSPRGDEPPDIGVPARV